MQKLTDKDIKKIAKLARIELDENSTTQMTKQISDIISFADQLSEVNTDSVSLLNNDAKNSLKLHQDEITDGNKAEDILKNSNYAKYNYFTVPKVIE